MAGVGWKGVGVGITGVVLSGAGTINVGMSGVGGVTWRSSSSSAFFGGFQVLDARTCSAVSATRLAFAW
ncbi:hypothetical protein BST45_18505 [Mycobacterium shinjukuense]|nr:hypothetical protein BST45_18505 [Mycobacterium shinjukuense]